MLPSAAQAYQSLTAFKPQSAQDIQTQAETKYDIPGANTRVSNLRGLVNNLSSSVEAVDPSVRGRTSGNFVTEGQNQALVNKERQPLLGSLAKEQTALGEGQANLSSSQNLAQQMVTALTNQDHQKYQMLLDQYNAADAAEKQAEAKRQFEATLAEQKRQADASRAASSGGGYDLSSILNGLNKPAAAAAPSTDQDWAYQNVQKFLGTGNDAAIKSDYAATLDSANRGNARDKLKIALYQQKRPDLFSTSSMIAKGVNSGGLTSYGVSPNNSGLSSNILAGLRFN